MTKGIFLATVHPNTTYFLGCTKRPFTFHTSRIIIKFSPYHPIWRKGLSCSHTPKLPHSLQSASELALRLAIRSVSAVLYLGKPLQEAKIVLKVAELIVSETISFACAHPCSKTQKQEALFGWCIEVENKGACSSAAWSPCSLVI